MEQSDQNKIDIKVIGFDLDGTLYQDTPEIRGRIRNKIYEKISELCEISKEKAKELFEENYSELYSGTESIKKISKIYQANIGERDVVQESVEEADIIDLIEKNPELYSMLERLSKTKELDLVTGSRRDLAIKKLSKLGIPPKVFQYILVSEDGSKTTGDKYSNWLRKRGFKPEQHLYVGDNKKQDIDVPKSLGIRTCIVGSYEPADFQIKNILELGKLFFES